MRRIETIEADISKTLESLARVKARESRLMERLEKLQELKRRVESKKIVDAFRKSKKSYGELMTFLNP